MNVLGAPAGFAQMMAKESLTQVTDLNEQCGNRPYGRKLDPGALLGTADSMNFGLLQTCYHQFLKYWKTGKGKVLLVIYN